MGLHKLLKLPVRNEHRQWKPLVLLPLLLRMLFLLLLLVVLMRWHLQLILL